MGAKVSYFTKPNETVEVAIYVDVSGARPRVLTDAEEAELDLENLPENIVKETSTWLVPALGGAPLHVGVAVGALLPITLATGFAAVGVALLIAAVARSAVQATTIGGAINLLMAAVSGIMVPRAIMPDALQPLGKLSPMSWAVDGYWDVILRDFPARETLPECLALLALGGICMGLASRLLKMENG